MARNAAPRPEVQPPDNAELLEALLTVPGNTMGAYSRFHNYSPRNVAWFYMQGIEPQPVATYNKWQELGRQVMKGSSAKYVLRPITVKLKDELDDQGQPKQFTKFKAVKAIFALSDTEGEPLPPLETPKWSLERALGRLSIEQVPFEHFDGNTAGYSYERKMAVSDVAPNRLKTACHEIGHIILGHTTEGSHEEYANHRGVFEFEAEATAYLTLNELDAMDERTATVSRGYVQNWLRGEVPSAQSIARVFKATDLLVHAGYEEAAEELPESA